MTRCPPKSTRPDTLFPDPTLFLSVSRIDFENQHRAHLDEEARLHELAAERATLGGQVADNQAAIRQAPIDLGRTLADLSSRGMELDQRRLDIAGTRSRSEEHTSALQSIMRISYAVFFLEKKK